MAEYIEREALKNEIATSTEPFNTGSVFRAINRQAAADVATVVHGRWMKHIKGGTLCSRCGSYTQHNGDIRHEQGYCLPMVRSQDGRRC